MSIRSCASPVVSKDARVHLFREGSEKTLCGYPCGHFGTLPRTADCPRCLDLARRLTHEKVLVQS